MKTVTLSDKYSLDKINIYWINDYLLWTDADYRLEIKRAVNLINNWETHLSAMKKWI